MEVTLIVCDGAGLRDRVILEVSLPSHAICNSKCPNMDVVTAR